MKVRTPWTTWAVLAVVLVAQCFLLLWHHGHSSTQPHQVPLVVQGPPVVSQAVADRLNRLPGEPVEALVVNEPDLARASVRDGKAAAALVIDLSQPANVLYVASVNDPEMTRLATTVAARVGQPMERASVTRTVAPREHADLDRSTVARVSGWWVASGFLVAVAWALVRRLRRRSRDSTFAPRSCSARSAARRAWRPPS